MCLILSEVRSVRPSLVVWKGPFSLSSTWGSGNTEGTPCPPSLQIAPPTPSQLCLSTLGGISSALGYGPDVSSFLFLVRLLSFLRGRASSGDTPETPPCASTTTTTTIAWCLSAGLLVCSSAHPRPHPHATSSATCPILSAIHDQAAGTLPICSIYAPRVSLPVHPTNPADADPADADPADFCT